jgi:hypothetical protein
LLIETICHVNHTSRFIKNACLTLSQSGLLGTLSRLYSELARDQGRREEDKQGNPFFPARNDKGIQRWNQEKIESENGNYRCHYRCISPSCRRQEQDEQQVDKGNVWNGRIQMVRVDDPGHSRYTAHSHETINEIALPLLLCRRRELWNLFNLTHRNSFHLI